MDDILVGAMNIDELRPRIFKLFNIFCERNMKISQNRFQCCLKVKFGGIFIVSDGININVIPTEDRLEGIRVLPAPTCVKEVQTLIEMIC